MADEKKNKRDIFSMDEFLKRPVTEVDLKAWCTELKEHTTDPKAPNGYVVRVPECFDGMKLIVEGAVKNSAAVGSTLFIQVDPTRSGRTYYVDFPETGSLSVRLA